MSWRPAGFDEKVIVTFRGRRSKNVDVLRPPESVTVRWMRYQTLSEVSPVVGITNVPLFTPVHGARNGWKCVSWWKSTCHSKAVAGRVPSSGSVPVPE